MNVLIKEYKPSGPLRDFVSLYWSGSFNLENSGRFRQTVVPSGFVEIIIHLSDIHCELQIGDAWFRSPDFTIIGLYTRPYEVQFRAQVPVFGIRFKPEGFYNVFGVPVSEFGDNYDDMEAVAGTSFQEFCSRLREAGSVFRQIELADRYLLQNVKRHGIQPGYLNHAAELIRNAQGLIGIETLSSKVFISPRQLEREFKQKIGISPKRYFRIARLSDAYRMLENGEVTDLTSVAYDSGFADQSHFIRDFKAFTGTRPGIFTRNRKAFIVNRGSS